MKSIVSLDNEMKSQLHRLACIFPRKLADLSVRVHKTPSNNFVLTFETIVTMADSNITVSGHGWTAEEAVNNVMKRLKITTVQQYIQTKEFEELMDHMELHLVERSAA
ncbi:hypothetical protein [Methylophaga sp.]|uniref:hypothetical protein n=1 Tax=Methylophaga sp. TaxID=2024840 RepID=UPI003A91F4C2